MGDNNLQVIKSYMNAKNAEERLALYADDGFFELPFSHSMIFCENHWEGKKELEELETTRGRLFPDWVFYDTKYHPTQYPNVIFVRTMGRGHYTAPDSPARLLENYYYLQFTVRDGKITKLRQFQNPYVIANMLEVH